MDFSGEDGLSSPGEEEDDDEESDDDDDDGEESVPPPPQSPPPPPPTWTRPLLPLRSSPAARAARDRARADEQRQCRLETKLELQQRREARSAAAIKFRDFVRLLGDLDAFDSMLDAGVARAAVDSGRGQVAPGFRCTARAVTSSPLPKLNDATRMSIPQYRAAFVRRMRGAGSLYYGNCGWGDEEAGQLCDALEWAHAHDATTPATTLWLGGSQHVPRAVHQLTYRHSPLRALATTSAHSLHSVHVLYTCSLPARSTPCTSSSQYLNSASW